MTSDRPLGRPRLHLRETSSTNDRARELAAAGAPHGTLVTTSAQSAGRGRQGRSWSAPSGGALLCSLVLRGAPRLLPLAAAVATAEATGRENAQIKWPNDILLEGRKVAGILVEGRPQEGWAVCGIGINVALRTSDLPPELHERAGTLGLEPADVEGILERLLATLARRLADPPAALLDAWRARDVLSGSAVRWATGAGVARGIDGEGRLVVERSDGGRLTLDAGEVHLLR
ncbi:MAG: biotin--[acetyl-CoA-carboxylase] ligase [Solirubrobacterales bacterium]|nr:biotin--[acetyl-CoA-carboxylase] ligase [Solirubrobacterales bacterium]